jgi:hypothetical protein
MWPGDLAKLSQKSGCNPLTFVFLLKQRMLKNKIKKPYVKKKNVTIHSILWEKLRCKNNFEKNHKKNYILKKQHSEKYSNNLQYFIRKVIV